MLQLRMITLFMVLALGVVAQPSRNNQSIAGTYILKVTTTLLSEFGGKLL